MADRKALFDRWADRYAPGDRFPFLGYEAVLDAVVRHADTEGGHRVLDLGIGTGGLAARLRACRVWGLDFSRAMLRRARALGFPLVQADLRSPLPFARGVRFDRIVASYALHELDPAARKALLAGGRIVVGDVSFPSARYLEAARERWRDAWDDGESYWAADEVTGPGRVAYEQVSPCGGVYVFASEDGGAGS